MSHPQRLLEVTINSAHDLPPMAKMLRTFVVAWVNPDNKLSTRVDHHGHTNPTWNDKLLFRVDDDFLRSESSTVMMVIYNLAWLRDLPMGTTNLNIGQILKSLTHKNQALRNITLHIRRPTGHLQGTLNVSVNIAGYPLPTSIHEAKLLLNQPKQETLSEKFDHLQLESKVGVSQPKQETLSPVFDHLELDTRQPKQETLSEVFKNLELETKLGAKKNKISQNKISRRSSSMNESESDAAEFSPLSESSIWMKQSETGTKTRATSSNDSLFPQMKHVPSEVSSETKKGGYSDMKKGYYSHSQGSSTCNDVFENWTDAGSTERNTWRSKSSRWGVDDHLNNLLVMDNNLGKQNQNQKHKHKHTHTQKKKNSSNERGLMSCFGNFNGFQCKIFCGSKNGKKKRKSKYESKDPIFATSEQSLRRFKF